MKIEMSGMPSSPYEIIVKEDQAFIRFYENAEEISTDEIPKWKCDMYQLQVRNRPNLAESVQTHYNKWLAAAKAKEMVAEQPTTEERLEELASNVNDAMLAIMYLSIE